MSNTITIGATIITPDQVDGYTSIRESGNIVHRILGNPSPDVTFRPAQLRTGTLRLVFDSEAEAKAAEDAHATATTTCTLDSDDAPTVAMTYVTDGAGRISRSLDDETRDAWILEVPFQEVVP